VEYEVKVSKGFTELKPSAYTVSASEAVLNFRHSPADKSNMARYLFGGFGRCLYPVQKFQSDSERKLAVILERETDRWFKPGKGQFQLFYQRGADHPEYQPDFVAETTDRIYMIEPKARGTWPTRRFWPSATWRSGGAGTRRPTPLAMTESPGATSWFRTT
jgi:type III restriction enzyme